MTSVSLHLPSTHSTSEVLDMLLESNVAGMFSHLGLE